MNLNLTCCRDILLYVESLPFNKSCGISELSKSLTTYTSDEIEYNCLKMIEAGYLSAITAPVMNRMLPGIKSIEDITYAGHEFLNSIKPESIWKKIQPAIAKSGAFTLNTVQQICTPLLMEFIKSLLA